VRHSAAAQVDTSGDRLRWNAIGDALVDDVHDAADSVAAVEQCGWPAQDFDLLRARGIDGDGVIGTDVRGVGAAEAFAENADAIGAKSADDRTAGAGAEIRRADAGLVVERLSDRGLQ